MKIKQALFFAFEILQVAVIALAIVVPIRYFIFQPFIVKGESMEPNFQNGDYLIVDEISYRFRDPQRGEVIVFHYPNDPSQRFIKRIIGLPNETIEINNNKIIITKPDNTQATLDETSYLFISQSLGANEIIKLPPNQYFVMGDNREHSFDSRKWGVLEIDKVIGRVILRAWPITSLTAIAAPNY